MPKELTHWWLAAEAQRQLPLGCATRQLLDQEQHAYLIGAVLPDTLLHLIRGQWSGTALQLARNFHEPDDNSFKPLLQFVEKADLTPAMTACLLGIAAHMEADIVFHPYICPLAGDDLGKHYRIETELDLWLLHEGRNPPIWRLKELLKGQAQDLIVRVAQGVFDPQGELPGEVFVQALRLHSTIQALYGAPGWQLLARLLACLPIAGFSRYQNLFYPFQWQRGQNTTWPEQWRHRTTGEHKRITPEELTADAIARTTQLLQQVATQGLLSALKKQPGEDLITGLTAHPCHTPTTNCATALQ